MSFMRDLGEWIEGIWREGGSGDPVLRTAREADVTADLERIVGDHRELLLELATPPGESPMAPPPCPVTDNDCTRGMDTLMMVGETEGDYIELTVTREELVEFFNSGLLPSRFSAGSN